MMYHISIISEGDCMKEEIHKAFDDYLERFQSDENVCESIKKLVLEQLGCGSELDAVLRRFLEIAETQHYPYATPLGYAMLFFRTYASDISAASGL